MARGVLAKTHFLKNTNMNSLLEPVHGGFRTEYTATKVIATIGPACQDVDTLCKILEAGCTCARLDLTWGTLEFHQQSLTNLKAAQLRTRKLCAVMVDTVGRELLVNRPTQLDDKGWPVHEGNPLKVSTGQSVTLTVGGEWDEVQRRLPISYPKFPSMAEPGDTIFLGRYLVSGAEDASLYLQVTDVTATEVVCEAKNNAVLDGLLTVFHTERSADSLLNLQNDLPVLSPYDCDAIKAFSATHDIDFISLSFTRTAEDVVAIREFLDSIGLGATKILAKAETRQALLNIEGISAAADGVVMSRGNLGLDVLPEKMALIQKTMIANCNMLGKPIIITRVVDTMVSTPRPTRAEATDVANAVLDGADAFLLGAETLRGRYPVPTIKTILSICRQAELVFDHEHHFEHLMQSAMNAELEDGSSPTADGPTLNHRHNGSTMSFADGLGSVGHGSGNNLNHSPAAAIGYLSKLESIASSAVRAADKVQASLIIVYTQSGTTASLVAKYRPPMPILTLVVPQLKSDALSWRLIGGGNARQCLIQRGLLPVLAAPSPSGETLLEEAVSLTSRWGLVKPNDHIVCVQKVHDAFIVKIVTVDGDGGGIAAIRPKSLMDMMKAAAGIDDEDDEGALQDAVAPTSDNVLGGKNTLVPAVDGKQGISARLRGDGDADADASAEELKLSHGSVNPADLRAVRFACAAL